MEEQVCFISYARENVAEAQILYRRLREAGLNPWMDKPPAPYKLDGLKPGELWEDRLREIIRKSKYFLPLFSKISVEKSGYVQSEFRQALTRLAEIPAGKTFVIPIRIEECDIPKVRIDGISFAQYHYIDCLNGYFADLVAYILSLEGRKDAAVEHRHVEVYSPQEFLEAIGSNTEILIKESFSLTGVGVPDSRHIYAREVFDGEDLVFANIENLKIRGDGLKEITVSPRYATTLNFKESRDISIEGVRLGHKPDIGECQGAVMNFSGCSSVAVKNCQIFGCGTYGFQLSDCDFISFIDCDIFDCSYGFFTSDSVKSLKLSGVKFYNNQYFYGMDISNCDVSFENCRAMNNSGRGISSALFHLYRSEVSFLNTIFEVEILSELGIPSDRDGLSLLLREP